MSYNMFSSGVERSVRLQHTSERVSEFFIWFLCVDLVAGHDHETFRGDFSDGVSGLVKRVEINLQ
jgi:hypothetical protein